MKRIFEAFVSTRAMAVMLFIYAISMAVATFVENDFGTPAAKVFIYNAWWFDLLQVLLIINFIANIQRYRLYKKEKWPLLLFHLAFVVIFVGAAVTHLFSNEGMMLIREGDTSNEVITSDTYVRLNIFDQSENLSYETPYKLTYFDQSNTSWPLRRNFKKKYQFRDRVITLTGLDYVPIAKDTILPDPSGKETLELVAMGEQGRNTVYIQEGELKQISGAMVSFNNPVPGTIQLLKTDEGFRIRSPLEGESVMMAGQMMGTVIDSAALLASRQELKVDSLQELRLRSLYSIGPLQFVVPSQSYPARMAFMSGDKNIPEEAELADVMIVEYNDGEVRDTLVIRGGVGSTAYSARKDINGLQVSLGFGSKKIKTPFSIKLREFQLDRYPGSDNPASYASEITIIDDGKEEQHRIYMNNVLDHGGFRFYQSGYDPDEGGTRLSVNQDVPGTIITYIGYFMLFIGMFFTLFWRGTRFWKLQEMLKNLKRRKEVLSLVLLFTSLFAFAQSPTSQNVDTAQHSAHTHDMDTQHLQHIPTHIATPESIYDQVHFDPGHLQLLEMLQVQDDRGRMKPLGTHALELFRKIYKGDSFKTSKGNISAMAWFISLQQKPQLWANAGLIKASSAKLGNAWAEKIGINDQGRTSLLNLVDHSTAQYKLQEEYNHAFQKRMANQNEFDKEVISLTERFTIMDNVAKGFFLRTIPLKNDINETWTGWVIIQDGEPEIEPVAFDFWGRYFNELGKAQESGDWSKVNAVVQEISDYQKHWGKNVIISDTKMQVENIYNHLNPFFWAMIAYAMIGAFLLVLAFMQVLAQKSWLRTAINVVLGILILVLALHTAALGLRWYISGHAPWTNGYEAVIFVSLIGVLAGMIMYRNGNAFLPAAGAFVAVIMMGFAHGSSLLDPQITPLVPVLQSYWLIIHVAIITSSYGFFGLSMMIAFFTLILYIFKPTPRIDRTIKELVIVNEMSLIVGIFALTIGTFLGGMWANESWGRYWSWDPKETWAFISVIVYAVVLHMRLVPGLRGNFAFSIAALWAVACPIMTYFGVNYYLSGLHSYAAGDPIPIPAWIPMTVVAFIILSFVAYFIQRKQHPIELKA
ncbi:MAG: cytochrome c biogenesis protein CcsA [Weeksellaceae bacterium]|nr:cytochrome c biogenesis protein CcsA [Weeksellaceae bacterium]